MSKKPLSAVDLAWLRMDDLNNLMIITGIMTFDAPLDIERLKATIEISLLRFRRFRQRIVRSRFPFGQYYWEDDPGFNINDHIQRVILPPPGDQSALHDLISELMSHELDYSRPLWRFYIVEHYSEGSALICRLHHAIADGISLMQVLLSLCETTPDATWPVYQPVPKRQKTYTQKIKTSWENTARLTQNIWRTGSQTLREPDTAREYTQLGTSILKSALKLVLRWPDPATLYKGPLGIKKRAAWSAPLDLAEVKRIGRAFGGTVNDVLLSNVTGALRRYALFQGENIDPRNIRGVVPVNLRPVELDEELGNRFGLVFLNLPLSTADPVQRLYKLKFQMDNLKSSTEALAAFGILHLFGLLPLSLQNVGVNIFDTKGSVVMTNVPGPQEKIYLAGAPIDTIMAWVPQSGRISLGISIISYHGRVWLGVATDQALVPDPERILEFFNEEFEELKSRAEDQLEKRSQMVEPMLSQLDEALKALDDLLQ